MNQVLKVIIAVCFFTISGVSSAQENFKRSLENFTGLFLTGNIRVEIYKSDTARLEAAIKNLPEENLITEIKEDKLYIRLKTGSSKEAEVRVKVYYNQLDEISVSSRGLITSSEIISGKKVNFIGRSGGKIELELELDELKAEVVQGAILVFKGKVGKQEVNVNSGSTYSAYDLAAEESLVKAGMGGKAKVRASRAIEANSNSGAFIGYIGDPERESSKISLGGVITKYKNDEAAGLQ